MPPRASVRKLWVPAILVLGLVLQIVGLHDRSLNTDEVFTALLARSGDCRALAADVHPPLYPALLALLIRAGVPEIGWRLLSALWWLGAALGAYFLGRRLAGERVGLVALTLLATSPQGVLLGSLARSYALAACLGSWTLYLVARVFDEPTRRRVLGLAALAALGGYTFYYFFYLIAAIAAVSPFFWRSRRPAATALGKSMLLAVLLLIPGLALAYVQARAGLGQGWEVWSAAPDRLIRRVAQILAAAGGLDGVDPAIRAVLPAIAGVAATAVVYFLFAGGAWRLRHEKDAAPATMLLVAVELGTVVLALAAHFALGSFIAIHYFAILSGGVAVVLAAPFGLARRRGAIYLALAVVLANLSGAPAAWREGREDLRAASQWIDSRLDEASVVLGVAWFATDGYRWYGHGRPSLGVPDDLRPPAARQVRARPGIAGEKDMAALLPRLANCRTAALLLAHTGWRGADRGTVLVAQTLQQAGFAAVERRSWPPNAEPAPVRAVIYRRPETAAIDNGASCGFVP